MECFKCKLNYLKGDFIKFSCGHSICHFCFSRIVLIHLVNNINENDNIINCKCETNGIFKFPFSFLQNLNFNQNINANINCMNHSKNFFFYCKNDKTLLCEDCINHGEHNSHEIININEKIQQYNNSFKNFKFKNFNEMNNYIINNYNQFENKIEKTYNDEISKIDELITILKKYKESILNQKYIQKYHEKVLFSLIQKYYSRSFEDYENMKNLTIPQSFYLFKKYSKTQFNLDNFIIKHLEKIVPAIENTIEKINEIIKSCKLDISVFYPYMGIIKNYEKIDQIKNIHKYNTTCITHIKLTDQIATASTDKTINIFNQNLNSYCLFKKITAHLNAINSLCNINNFLISGGKDLSVKIWDIKNDYNCIQIIDDFMDEINKLTSFNNGKNFGFITCGEETSIKLYTLNEENKFQINQFLDGHESGVNDIIVMNNNDLISGGNDTAILIWKDKGEVKENYILDQCIGISLKIGNLCKFNDKFLVGLERQFIIKLFGYDNAIEKYIVLGEINNNVHEKQINQIIMLKDSRIATCSFDKSIKIWRFNELTNEFRNDQILKEHNSIIYGITENKKGRLLSVGMDCSLVIWKKKE